MVILRYFQQRDATSLEWIYISRIAAYGGCPTVQSILEFLSVDSSQPFREYNELAS